MSWEIAKLGPRARHVAERAAHRAGMTPEEWLNEAIVKQAASTRSQDPDEPQFSNRRHESNLEEEGDYDVGLRRVWRLEDQGSREAENLLEATIERIERRITGNGRRIARAFEAIAQTLERSTANLDHAASERASRSDTAVVPKSHGTPLSVTERGGAYDSYWRTSHSQSMFDTPKVTAEQGPKKVRLDLRSALSQIAARQRELDAREPAKHTVSDRSESGTIQASIHRDTSDDTANPRPVLERATSAQAMEASISANPSGDTTRPQTGSPDELRADIHTLAGKLDNFCRADPRISAADVNAMRAEIRAITRSLADLAPRNAIVGLEGAVRDLTQRVETLRQSGHRESILAPLDAMAAELCATLKTHDPTAAAAVLERELRAIGEKIDGLAPSAINPETFERIRLQTEEVRDLLVEAAMRSTPAERLERQIGELADRIERLGASLAPHMDSVQMAASLGDVRKEIERTTPLPILGSIERRLEHIATRLDQEILHPSQVPFDSEPFDDLARRIDSVRDAIEARPQPPVEANPLEASLRELNAKLESANTEPLAALVRGLSAKLDAVGQRDAEARPLEPLLESVIRRLDQFHLPGVSVPAFDRQAIKEIAEEIALRLQEGRAGRTGAELLTEQIAIIHDKVDSLSSRGELAALEPLVRELLDKLREGGFAIATGGGSTDNRLNVAAELAEMRAEQVNAERRTQLRLAGLQELLDKLVGRLADVENDAGGDIAAHRPQGAGVRKPSVNGLRDADSAAAEVPLGTARRSFDASSPTAGGDSSTPPTAGEEFLLEPGAGAPQRARDARDLAQAIGLRTNPAVSAHIAAARRAAHAALAGTGDHSTTRQEATSASRSLMQAKTFYDSHKRSVLLVVALVIVATVAVRVVGMHPSFLQGPESQGKPSKAAATDAFSGKGLGFAPSGKFLDFSGAVKTEAQPVDTTPTASIAPSSELTKSIAIAVPPPPQLIAALPIGLPQPLRDAVVAGSLGAQYELAQRLLEGRGLQQDQHAAALWFERAASSGLAPAQFRIGTLYQKGVGFERDAAAAKRWYTSAAEAGNARAAHNLAVMYAEPVDEKPNYLEAAKWFRKAAELGVRDSQYNLAVLYARGLGVDQDLRQSWLWFSLASEQGDADAATKRDEVAAKMDPAALAAAGDELAKFKAAKPEPAANDVPAPPGGWDAKPLSLATPALGGPRPRTTL